MSHAKIERETGVAYLPINQGSHNNITVEYEDGNGNAIDLTGYSARMQIRRHVNHPNTIISLTTASDTANGSGVTISGKAGKIDITITDEDSKDFDFTEGVYDIEIVSSGGEVLRLLEGPVDLFKEVTR